MSSKTTGRHRRWRQKFNQWIKSSSSTTAIVATRDHHKHNRSEGSSRRQVTHDSSPDVGISPSPSSQTATSYKHARPVLPTLPKLKPHPLRPYKGELLQRRDNEDVESEISLEPSCAPGSDGEAAIIRGIKDRHRQRASSLPPVPLGHDKLVNVPSEWNQRRVYSLIERRSSTDYTLTLTDFLQAIFNEQMEGSVDYRVHESNWRAGLLKIDGFQLVVRDERKQAHHIGLSIVVDLSCPQTEITYRDYKTGTFIIKTARGSLELRDRLRYGSWIDIIERKQVVAKKLSS